MTEQAAPHGSRRILMLTQDLRIDRRILLEADALRTDGWTVTVVAMPHEEAVSDDPPGVVRARVPATSAGRERAVLGLYRMIRRHLPMDGGAMRFLKTFAWRTVADPSTFFSRLLGETAGEHPAEIVVAHDLPMLPLAGELACRFGARLVYDSHELFLGRPMSGSERRRWRLLEAHWVGQCDAIITVNGSIARELERSYGRPGIEVITNAERPLEAAPDPEALRRRAGLSSDARIVLYQGGLLAGRNLEVLVDSMAAVSNPRIHLVLLGDGALGRGLAARIRRKGLGSRVRMLPAVPQTELLALTGAADVGVVPYVANCLNSLYCTPNKLYEFIAAGVPVLASDLPEIRALVEEYGLGWIAPLDTVAGMSAAIEACLADPEGHARRREATRLARERISWDREAHRLREIYRALLNGGPDRP